MEREESFQKVHPLHTLEGKHSELWHNIFVWCFDMVTTPLRLGACVISMYRSVTHVSAHWRCFAVSNGYAVIVISLVNLSCIPAGSRESRGLG